MHTAETNPCMNRLLISLLRRVSFAPVPFLFMLVFLISGFQLNLCCPCLLCCLCLCSNGRNSQYCFSVELGCSNIDWDWAQDGAAFAKLELREGPLWNWTRSVLTATHSDFLFPAHAQTTRGKYSPHLSISWPNFQRLFVIYYHVWISRYRAFCGTILTFDLANKNPSLYHVYCSVYLFFKKLEVFVYACFSLLQV